MSWLKDKGEGLRARERGTVGRGRRERENCPLRVIKSPNMRGHAEMNGRDKLLNRAQDLRLSGH